MNDKKVKHFQQKLLDWYDIHSRDLPWRSRGGVSPDPYLVWLSEVMLQQTTIATVKEYFLKFKALWPTLKAFSQASEDDILAAWSGLGYYSRARNLKKTADILVSEYGASIPEDYKTLISLPGIGDYTASAISAIAFNRPAVVVDGNVERVVSRIFKIEQALPKNKKIYRECAGVLSETPYQRHGDFAQAMMDLGSTVCMVTAPKCETCPVSMFCKAYASGAQLEYPKKEKKKTKPKKYAGAYFLKNKEGAFFIRKRSENGMLANMYEVPTTQWHEDKSLSETREIPFSSISGVIWRKKSGVVKHVFTHFEFFLDVYVGEAGDLDLSSDSLRDGFFVEVKDLSLYAIPTVVKKVIDHARSEDVGFL